MQELSRLSNMFKEVLARRQRRRQEEQAADRNRSGLAEIEALLSKAESMVAALESEPTAVDESEIRHLAIAIRSSVFASAVSTFVGTIDANYGKYGTISAVEYEQIAPLLDRWRSPAPQEPMDETAFREFRTDLDAFSHDHPDWFEDGTVSDWFEQDVWNVAFRQFHDKGASLCTVIIRILETRAGRMRELVDSNYACMSSFEFEHLVAELLRRMGYEAAVTNQSGDYGVDVVARNGDETIAIQVKKYSPGNNVGNREVQMILGAMQLRTIRATKAVLITTSDFTIQAREQAKECPVELWDGAYLSLLVQKYFCQDVS